MTVAAGIDCGTNSVRLLVADVEADGTLSDLSRQLRIVRLGQGVDATGRLVPEAIERTRLALVDYRAAIEQFGASAVRMVATSATRDATNRDAFTTMVRDTLGVEPEVISGVEEAQLSFRGAVHNLARRARRPGLTGDLLVIDLGGGSTELVRGRADALEQVIAHSMDVGCVRLTERRLHDDPPTPAQVAALVADVEAALDRAATDVPLHGATVVGVAGTVTTVAAIGLGLDRYDPDRIDGSVLASADVAAISDRLLRMDHRQRSALPVMHPGRVDVITAGALVLATVLARTGARELVVSEHDILDGITVAAAERAG